MKPEIENLKVWMSGRSTIEYQKALGMREFEKLLDYVAELEQLRQPAVMPSLHIEKLKQIRRVADDVYHDLVSSNHPTHDEWCSSPKNLKIIMSIVDKLLGNEA